MTVVFFFNSFKRKGGIQGYKERDIDFVGGMRRSRSKVNYFISRWSRATVEIVGQSVRCKLSFEIEMDS